MSDLVEWLRARIEERKAIAEAATPGRWEVSVHHHGRDQIEVGVRPEEADTYITQSLTSGDKRHEDATHIARNNPHDVIARCNAELGILDRYVELGILIAMDPKYEEQRLAMAEALLWISSGYKTHRHDD